MRRMAWVVIGVIIAGWMIRADARDKPIEELPRDVWNLAFVWTEPLKQAARESRRFDPMSGVWFGLIEGSIKSVQRAADFLILEHDPSPTRPSEPANPQFRYSF